MSERKAQDQDKFILRLPDGMRDRIKAAADLSRRSMNAEIVARLEESFAYEGEPSIIGAGEEAKTIRIISQLRKFLESVEGDLNDAIRRREGD
ncbi:Arc family DNA-binding protein [Cereibacter sphaeroides]|uniref:Arc family DNA-binding protein n=1 Tax=Cereibacter sphaeroides TaxID=1063 RepID=UPI001F39357C|nr:Arc family DNA-binding protein [Cereibacter sphaeroides]MCE6951689.1 Arc family DNA-binding protein [Cereibacter sphaeroides]